MIVFNSLFLLMYVSLFALLVLVGLYEEPERPPNAVDYIKRYIGAPSGIDVDGLKVECEQLRKEKARLEAKVAELQSRIDS